MPRRSSSTSGFSAGVFESISGNIDNVVTVGENIDIIKQLMDMPGFEDLLIEARETLDFTNITVVSGTEASWNSDTKVLTVPTVKGDKGDSLAMSSVVDNGNSTFTWGFSDGTLFTTPDLRGTKGDTGVQGEKGDQGEKGLDAVPLTLVDITDNGNYTFDWEFSDGFVYTTPALRGHRGDKGEKGDSLSLDGVEHIGDGIFTWTFSDGTVFTTPRLKGDQGPQGVIGLRGLQGERGIGVHHMKATSTTELNGDFGAFGEKDTYTFYGDADETIVLGWFTVMNGINSAEDLEAVGVMTRSHYDTNNSGAVDNSDALGGKTLAELEQERDDLLDLKLDKAGGTIENDLTIQGNLYVNGTETVVNTETVEVADNEIVINAGEPGTGVTKGTAGIRVDRGSAPDYLFQFDETSDSFKVGEESSLQQIATREDTPLDAGVAVWDDSSSRFRTTKDLDIDSLNTTGLVNGRDIPTDGTKLDGIEEEATADQTAEEIEALYESNPDTNKYTDQEKQFVDVTTTLDTVATTLPAAVNEVHAEVDSVVDGTTDIVFDNAGTFIAAATLEGAIKEVSGEVGDVGSLDTVATTIVGAVNELYTELDSADSRLDALEMGSHTHSNKSVLDDTTASYTVAEETKLDGIEVGAKDDQVASEVPVVSTGNLVSTDVQSALEELQLDVDTVNSDLGTKVDKIVGKGLSDTNFTQAEKTKLDNIALEATKNRTDSENADKVHTHTTAQVVGLDSALESKVDKVVGQGLSDTNYTQAEKDKLAGLESSRFKGQYISLVALQAAFPIAFAGDYANVDEGVGQDVVRYVWDTSDVAWIPQLGISTQLTTAQIKQEYESNPDTNVFSDYEKLKLSEIEAGAQVNIGTDLDYTASSRELSSSTGTGVTLPQVTTTLDGLMLSVDKNKLDTVEANAKDDQEAGEVPVTPLGSLVATNVQSALEDLHTNIGTLTEVVEKNTAVTGTSTLVRYDKLLGNLDVIQMGYTDGDLTTVRYSGDNNTDSFYRDVLVYSSGNLASIKHYCDKPNLATESAETVLVYDVDSNLISTQYTEL